MQNCNWDDDNDDDDDKDKFQLQNSSSDVIIAPQNSREKKSLNMEIMRNIKIIHTYYFHSS